MHESRGFDSWQENHAWTYAPAFDRVGVLPRSLKEHPPRQGSADFNIDEAMKEKRHEERRQAEILATSLQAKCEPTEQPPAHGETRPEAKSLIS